MQTQFSELKISWFILSNKHNQKGNVCYEKGLHN